MLADKAGVKRTTLNEWHQWQRQELHTLYLFDVRAASEYEQGQLSARHVPGGQLVQETDHYASVRHARIVLIDDDGVRANSTGSWLAQLAQLIGKPVTVLKGGDTAWKAAGLPVVFREKPRCCYPASIAIVALMKAPITHRRRCKPISTGNMVWLHNWIATGRMVLTC